jgi:hypothetical protein
MDVTVLAVRHTVADYDAWKQGFDRNEDARRRHHCQTHRVLRSGNDILVVMDFPSADDASAFAADPSLKSAMESAGVQGAPDISFRDEAETKAY